MPAAPLVLIQLDAAKPDHIQRIRKKTLQKKTGNPHVQGLTTTQSYHKHRASYAVQSNRDGTICLYLKKLTLTVGYRNTKVYINRNYFPGTCQFRVIKDHEMRHVRIYNTTLTQESNQLHRDLKHYFSSYTVRTNKAGLAHAKERIKKKISQRVRMATSRIKTRASLDNLAIDTRSAYAREKARCSSW
uniref:Uncharacterized protein n=1 Tax=Magnetococcus massalia (strain MO-1) TaxID=451514 RepID=A0A1S7LFE5_MAGMO|nr:Conserved protein of unknown function [Candidatus Magnetococcus massalia]